MRDEWLVVASLHAKALLLLALLLAIFVRDYTEPWLSARLTLAMTQPGAAVLTQDVVK